MPSNFPTGYDAFSTKVDGVDDVLAAHVNNLQDSASAIQQNIGLTARGSMASLSARLAVSLNPDGTLTPTALGSIPDGSILTNMLADGAVTTPKLANNAVTSAKIANNAVGATQLATAAVQTAKIADGAVTTIKVGDSQITDAKIVSLDASKLTGTVPTSVLGTGTADATTFLHGDNTWAALVASDIPSLDASKITTGTVATARLGSGTADSTTFLRGDQTWAALTKGCAIILCEAFTPAATGADTAEVMVPYDPADGTTSVTWNVRRIWLRVNASGGAPVVVIEKSTGGNVAFSATTVGTITFSSGDYEGAVTSSLGTVASGNKLRFNVTTLGTATGWSIGVELGA